MTLVSLHQQFQDHLFRGRRDDLTYHSELSSLFTCYVGSSYLDKQDVPDELRTVLKVLCVVVVKRHHGNLDSVSKAIERFSPNVLKQTQAIDDSKLSRVLADTHING